MTKLLIAAAAFVGAIWLIAPADAASRSADGITNVTTTDLSAHRRRYRHTHRRVVRYYDPPRYYGYYGPTYYERPYRRPAPLWFGLGGYW